MQATHSNRANNLRPLKQLLVFFHYVCRKTILSLKLKLFMGIEI